MPSAETARLIASLELKDQFSGPAGRITKSLDGLDRGITNTQGRAYKAGQQIGTGIKNGALIAASGIAFLGSQVLFGIKQLATLEEATAATNAGLKSTKGASGQTADSIRNLAEQYEALNATIDDKVIQSGENVLLTFTNIRKQAFEPALQAALDLSVGMKQDLQTSVVQLGKALNDPIKGLTSLSRIGVAFSEDQKKQIKNLVEHNDLLGAQKIILAELSKEFGGRFKAAGDTAAGTLAGIGDAGEDLQKTLATGLFPVVQKLLPKIRAGLADPAVVQGVKQLGESIAGLFSDQNIAAGADILKGAFQTAKDAAPFVAAAAKTTFGFVQAAVGLFKSLPPQLQTLLVSGFAINKLTGGLVTNIAGGLISSVLKQLVSGVVNVNGAVVNVAGAGIPGAPVSAAAAGGVGTLGKVFLAAESIAAIGAIIATQQQVSGQSSALASGVGESVNKQITGGATLADLQASLAAVDKGLADIANTPLSVLVRGDALDQLKAQHLALVQQIAIQKRQTGGLSPDDRQALNDQAQKLQDVKDADLSIAGYAKSTVHALGALKSELHSDLIALKKATDPAKIAAAAKKVAADVTKGAGSLSGTNAVLAELRKKLDNTHDPKLQAALKAAIGAVQAKLPNREFAAKQYDALNKMLRDGKLTNSELKNVAAIERSLRDRGLPHAAEVIARRVDAAKAAQVSATHAGTDVLRRKKFSSNITIPVSVTNRVTTTVNSRTVVKASTEFKKYFATVNGPVPS